MELLRHYSNAPVAAVHSVQQRDTPHMKPLGFWISVDGNEDGWKDWCEGEGYRVDNLTHVHEIELSETAPILRLTNASEIRRFHGEYQVSNRRFDRYALDWSMVARKFSGIIIAPYIWEMRLDDECEWYYSWDCASGCIWDASAIKCIKLLQVEMAD